MEPTGLLMAALIIGLLVLALGIDQATQDTFTDAAVTPGGDCHPGRAGKKHR